MEGVGREGRGQFLPLPRADIRGQFFEAEGGVQTRTRRLGGECPPYVDPEGLKDDQNCDAEQTSSDKDYDATKV